MRYLAGLLLSLVVLAGCQLGGEPRPAVIVDPTQSATAAIAPADAADPSRTPQPTRTPFLLPRTSTPVPRRTPATPTPPPATPPGPVPDRATPPATTDRAVISRTVSPTLPVVSRVVDGATFEIEQAGVTERIRLIGIDVPRSGSAGECWGGEALAHLRSLLPAGRPVILERDVQDRDSRNRLLRYVAVDGVSVNEVILAEGSAVVSLEPPNVGRMAALIDAQRRAVEGAKGRWRACSLAPAMVGPPSPVEIVAAHGTAAGGRATLVAQTAPNASCLLSYTTPAGTVSRQAALGPRQADAAGRATWEWTIARNTRPGEGHARVTCRGISVTVPIAIAPAAPTPARR